MNKIVMIAGNTDEEQLATFRGRAKPHAGCLITLINH